jgi:hypothetical protein
LALLLVTSWLPLASSGRRNIRAHTLAQKSTDLKSKTEHFHEHRTTGHRDICIIYTALKHYLHYSHICRKSYTTNAGGQEPRRWQNPAPPPLFGFDTCLAPSRAKLGPTQRWNLSPAVVTWELGGELDPGLSQSWSQDTARIYHQLW